MDRIAFLNKLMRDTDPDISEAKEAYLLDEGYDTFYELCEQIDLGLLKEDEVHLIHLDGKYELITAKEK